MRLFAFITAATQALTHNDRISHAKELDRYFDELFYNEIHNADTCKNSPKMESTDNKDLKADFVTIGTPGKPWGDEERAESLKTRKIERSYKDEVLDKLLPMKDKFTITQYGALPQDPERYPLFSAQTKNWSAEKPYILITGGVHGYETSGVQGSLMFLETRAEEFGEHFNILVMPCVSPWGYETIERWNAKALDPNRSFNPDGGGNPATDESHALIEHLKSFGVE